MAKEYDNKTFFHQGEHPIRLENMPLEVEWIAHRLLRKGFLAYLVGGAVRDLLIGKKPKDFDLSTDATPDQMRRIFHNCKIIGRRFQIAHIFFSENQIIEMSTFRALRSSKRQGLQLKTDNVFGSPEEDASRRDLTINGMFLNLENGDLIDYVGGMQDINKQIVRCIGNPANRYREDPVRMIRTIRHAARSGFRVEQETWNALSQQAYNIRKSSPDRNLSEFLKELGSGYFSFSLQLLRESGLLHAWLPLFHSWLTFEAPHLPFQEKFETLTSKDWAGPSALWKNMEVLDSFQKEGKEVPEIVLLAFLFLPVLWEYVFSSPTPPKRYGKLWQTAFDQHLLPMIEGLHLWNSQKRQLNDLIHMYWRLHCYPSAPYLQNRVKHYKGLPHILLLFQMEMEAQKQELPAWIGELEKQVNNAQ